MAVIHVHLYILGLIALVDRGEIMYALLIKNMHHTPFVSFDGSTCKGRKCPCFSLGADHHLGFLLDQEQIEIQSLTQGTTGAERILSQRPPSALPPLHTPVPISQEEAADMAWTPKMSDLLGTTPDFDNNCIDNKCKADLAGRIALLDPPLTTCSLVSSKQNCPEKEGIDEYTFFPNIAHQETRQALAEALVLSVDVPAENLEIKTKTFDGKSKQDIILIPKDCDEGKCIDLVIGNVPEKVPGCPERHSGPDFKFYYDLLVTPPLHRPIPIANGSAGPSSAQPKCPIPPVVDRDDSFPRREVEIPDIVLLTVNSRPVCAMVVF